jgi:hypothetical protein
LLAVLISGPAAVATVVVNNFDTDPQWTGENNRNGFNNYGYTNTTVAGGAAGEVGGVFMRRATESFYADTSFGGSFTLANVIAASGKFDATNTASMNNKVLIGHLSKQSSDPSIIGLTIEDGDSSYIRIYPTLSLANGSTVQGSQQYVLNNRDYWFSYSYNPSGGASAAGQLAMSVTNTTGYTFSWTVDLTAAQRAIGATFNAWGMYGPVSADTSSFGEVYIDDVMYTVPVPEPATGLLWLIGLGVWRWKRAAKH